MLILRWRVRWTINKCPSYNHTSHHSRYPNSSTRLNNHQLRNNILRRSHRRSCLHQRRIIQHLNFLHHTTSRNHWNTNHSSRIIPRNFRHHLFHSHNRFVNLHQWSPHHSPLFKHRRIHSWYTNCKTRFSHHGIRNNVFGCDQ